MDSFPIRAVHLDRLRFSHWETGVELDRVFGSKVGTMFDWLSPIGRGRNRGSKASWKRDAKIGDRGERGAVFLRAERWDQSTKISVEYNPAAIDDSKLSRLRGFLQTLGRYDELHFGVAMLDRVHFAVDFACPRYCLEWDDRVSKGSRLGITPKGPETQEHGYRSPVRVSLYDKRAERLHAGSPIDEDVTRLEVKVEKPDLAWPKAAGQPTFCSEVGSLAFPLNEGTHGLRVAAFHPGRVDDQVYGLLAFAVRGMGIRPALHHARANLGWSRERCAEWLSAMFPLHRPGIGDVWRERFPRAWADAVGRLCRPWDAVDVRATGGAA